MGKKNYKRRKKGIKAKTSGEVSMSLYDINKNIIGQLPAYDNEKLNQLEDDINDWEPGENQYFMFLCKEFNYYTILHRTKHEEADFPDLGQTITGLVHESNWTIHSDENCDTHYEIWVKAEDETYDFLLFPYDSGVVKYG